MAQLTIEPEGFAQLARRIRGVEFARVLRPPLVRSLERLRSSLAQYPEQPPAGEYARTGTLGRSWDIDYTVEGQTVGGQTGTAVRYAPYVQDAERQAWMHRGRWENTDQGVVDLHRGAVIEEFAVAIRRELDRGR